jgi:ClpX C4-type zinc finger/Bacterial protein of unknown function (DUF899)
MSDETAWIDGDLLRRSLCGRAQGQCAKLVAGPGVYICDGCVTLARTWPLPPADHPRDALTAERRRMPRMAVEHDYRLEGPSGS